MAGRARSRPATFSAIAIELALYGVLVTAYVVVVLRFFDHVLHGLFLSHRVAYAIAALALIVGQGVVLDLLSDVLVRLVRPRNG